MSRQLIVPIFIPHQGCNNACVFCNQRRIAGEYQLPQSGEIEELVKSYRDSYGEIQGVDIQVAFYGGSFTGLDEGIQEYLLAEVMKLKEQGLIHKIRMSTRPDYINEVVINRLMKYGVDIVELGVQSLEEDVLLASKRGHVELDVYRAVAQIRETPIELGIQIMIGLPKDREEKSLKTTEKVIALKPDFVRIYPTIVIDDTELAQMWRAGQYRAWELEEAVECCAEQWILFEQARIPVIRMGLQATEGLDVGGDRLAGPYHPAFGELVKARVFRKQLSWLLEQKGINERDVKIYCHHSELSQVTGQKKNNIAYFQREKQIELLIKGNGDIAKGDLTIMNDRTKVVFTRQAFLDSYIRHC